MRVSFVAGCTNKYLFRIFVDFKSAFDHLSGLSVLSNICEYGCQELVLWKSYCHVRKVFVQGVNIDGLMWNAAAHTNCSEVYLWFVYGTWTWNCAWFALFGQMIFSFFWGNSRFEFEQRHIKCLGIVNASPFKVYVAISTHKPSRCCRKAIYVVQL